MNNKREYSENQSGNIVVKSIEKISKNIIALIVERKFVGEVRDAKVVLKDFRRIFA
jgi:hypothetical protein